MSNDKVAKVNDNAKQILPYVKTMRRHLNLSKHIPASVVEKVYKKVLGIGFKKLVKEVLQEETQRLK